MYSLCTHIGIIHVMYSLCTHIGIMSHTITHVLIMSYYVSCTHYVILCLILSLMYSLAHIIYSLCTHSCMGDALVIHTWVMLCEMVQCMDLLWIVDGCDYLMCLAM